MTEAVCEFCGEPVQPGSRFTWHRVEGWERPGAAGGSDITLRQRVGDRFACDFCIRRMKSGVSPQQESLI